MAIQTGMTKFSLDRRRKLSEAHKKIPKEKHAMFGKHHSEETKRKIGAVNKGRKLPEGHPFLVKGRIPWNKGRSGCFSKQTLEKMSKSLSGKPPWNKGKKTEQVPWNKGKSNVYSALTLKEMSESRKGIAAWNKGIPCREETKRKIGAANKGRIWTKEQLLKLKGRKVWNEGTKESRSSVLKKQSVSHLGQIPWHKGKTGVYTEEMLERMRQNRLKQVIPTKDTKPEKMMQVALALNGIKFEKHLAIYGQPDLFIEPNICVFIDGDYWHCNPNKYQPDFIIHKKHRNKPEVSAKEIWAKDTQINHKLNLIGYQVIRIWASDIKSDANEAAKNIINLIKQSTYKN